ncbi:MAG: hypothetical protein QW768_06315 [Thermoproteota archaeon]
MNTKVLTFLRVVSFLFLVFALITVMASLLNISLFFLGLANEVQNTKVSFSSNYLYRNASLSIEMPIKNNGFLPLRLDAKIELFLSNGSSLGIAKDTKDIAPGELKTMSLTVQIEESNFMKIVENLTMKEVKAIVSFKLRTLYDLISVNISAPVHLSGAFSTGG